MLLALVLAIAMNEGSDKNVVRQLGDFEQRLAATWQKGDCSAWGLMLAPDWSVIHVTGDVITKEQALAMCKAPRSGSYTVSIQDVSVRVFGDAAVVTGRTTASGADETSKIVLRFTDVFIRTGGQWRVVASQSTQLLGAKARGRH
jgi:ketosteroid isomerase-like protein